MNDRDDIYKTLFKPGLKGDTNPEKAETWEREWKNYMFAFWNAIKNLYKKDQLWEAGSQLMYRATLEVLQDNFLDVKSVAGEAFSSPVKLRESVEKFYEPVPGGFFHKTWKRTELLTDDGREVLKNALNEMRVPGKKMKTLTETHPLFTGETVKKQAPKAKQTKQK